MNDCVHGMDQKRKAILDTLRFLFAMKEWENIVKRIRCESAHLAYLTVVGKIT